jgi:hypothetical protein
MVFSPETWAADRRLCISALAYYAERLRKVMYDKDITIFENGFLKLDLINESTLQRNYVINCRERNCGRCDWNSYF